MASCRQVAVMLQAWIDNELGEAERVILQEHVIECPACKVLLRQQQRTAALLFETFDGHRLKRNLRKVVLDHLPEMDPLRIDMKESPPRRKESVRRRAWLYGLVPVAFAAMLLVFGGLLYQTWPKSVTETRVEAVGVVTQLAGLAYHTRKNNTSVVPAFLKDYIVCGEYYQTGPEGKLLLTLRGPTHIKVSENTRIKVDDDREVNIDSGKAWFDVGKSERLFMINVPAGKLVIKGTTFEVQVGPDKTLVSVKTGVVKVSNRATSSEVKAGEQVEMIAGSKVLEPRSFDANIQLAWADGIVPDKDAYNFFATSVQMRPVAEMLAEQVFVVVAGDAQRTRAVSEFFVAWEPDLIPSEHCSYDVHIYNDSMVELFREHIDGSVFSDTTKRSYEIAVPGEPISKVNVIHIKLVPDFSTGTVKTSFTKVSALGI